MAPSVQKAADRAEPPSPTRVAGARLVGILMVALSPFGVLSVVAIGVTYHRFGEDSGQFAWAMIGHAVVVGFAVLLMGLCMAVTTGRVLMFFTILFWWILMAIPVVNTLLLLAMGWPCLRDPRGTCGGAKRRAIEPGGPVVGA